MHLHIRSELPTDLEAIDRVVADAFRTAPHTSGTEQFIVRQLRSAAALTISLVALRDGRVVGHVAVSPVSILDGSSGWFGLGPVAVLPEAQGQGIGSRLIEEALATLRRSGAAGCVVLGEPGYYGRFGFRHDAGLVLEGVPPSYFQALCFDGRRARGAVAYHPAFLAGA